MGRSGSILLHGQILPFRVTFHAVIRYRKFTRISDIQYPPLGVAANINRYGWILNIELPKMGASPQTPKLRGAARHYAVHQVEPHIIFMATKKQERMAVCGV